MLAARAASGVPWLLALAVLAACDGCDAPGEPEPAAARAEEPEARRPPSALGGPCLDDSDCEEGACLTDGFPEGLCTLPCRVDCAERVEASTEGGADGSAGGALCAATHQLGGDALEMGDGLCLPGCDYGAYPEAGCREGYGCLPLEAEGDPEALSYACMPGQSAPLTGCLAELAARGVAFTPIAQGDESPRGRSDLTCRVADPVALFSPLHGVKLTHTGGIETPRLVASCEMALALSDLTRELKDLGVAEIVHIGTYNCRTVAGTSSLSRHGRGDAIDIAGFTLEDGASFNVEEHFERRPKSEGGHLMKEVLARIQRSERWKVVLTPAYNAAHRDHFHVDLLSKKEAPDAFLARWPQGLGD